MISMFRLYRFALAFALVSCLESLEAFQASLSLRTMVQSHEPSTGGAASFSTSSLSATGGRGLSSREKDIRRKIAKLKREGRLKKIGDEYDEDIDDDGEFDSLIAAQQKKRPVSDAYSTKIRQKVGDAKSKLLGFGGADDDDDDEDEMMGQESVIEGETSQQPERLAQIGSLPSDVDDNDDGNTTPKTTTPIEEDQISSTKEKKPIIDPSLFESKDDADEDSEMSEEDLVDLVAQKMREKAEMQRKAEELEREQQRQLRAKKQQQSKQQLSSDEGSKKLTTGIGGSWNKNEAAESEMYQPKTGSWGAFPRPKDISKAYGGGRRVGATAGDEEARRKSEEDTRERLQRYREKVGIDVQSEKEYASQIDEALNVGMLAMQRGMYSTAVSALEKVTKYCSTNSKVGGKVFLELAMAYEAAGRTQEAVTCYTALGKSRIEDIKLKAKRLLYGLEAMQFMRDVKVDSFSRKKIKNTFIDTTGLANIASNFDDVYNTAYVDLEGNAYKRLTESVVRSAREARQVLLRATNAGEVGRLRVVQALRSISRRFEDALAEEITTTEAPEPVAFIDGKPILSSVGRETPAFGGLSSSAVGDEFVLADAKTMQENLDGEWRLQLLADKRGDGVRYFNSTLSWQVIDMMGTRTFSSAGPAGFVTAQQKGTVGFNEKRRILRRDSVEVSGGGVFTGLFGGKSSGAMGAVSSPQQVMSVDSVLLVTRGVPNKLSQSNADEKDYFAVWRRVEPGTYSSPAEKRTVVTTGQ